MIHARQQIRDAALTAVTGLATTAGRVSKSRLIPLDSASLPCLLVNTDNERDDFASIGMPALLSRTMELNIRAVAKVTANMDDLLDTMLAEVEVALGNTTLGGLVKSMEPRSISIEMEQGDKPVGVATLTYAVLYMTAQNAPQTII